MASRCVFVILSLVLCLCGCQGASRTVAPQTGQEAPSDGSGRGLQSSSRVVEDLGVEVIAVRTTAAGSMLDFRFRVLDREKAMPLFLEEIRPYLVDEASGKALAVPVPAKGGPMRPTSRDPRVGIVYFMLFGNPGKFVKPGSEVTLVLGEDRIENLVVQ